MFPLVQLPKKFRGNANRVVVWSACQFPLVQLPKKFRGQQARNIFELDGGFPLVQLPKKFRAAADSPQHWVAKVSISSTSEEV